MSGRVLRAAGVVGIAAALTLGPTALSSASPGGARPTAPGAAPSSVATGVYRVNTILTGTFLSHQVGNGTEPLTQPDDITAIGRTLFVGFQNGVGSMGQPSNTGNLNSTIVEVTAGGAVKAQWDVTGKVDGLTADPARDRLIATVNEDGNSSLYTIDLTARTGSQITHWMYSKNPLPHGGGTDSIAIDDGMILISASAPTVSTGPAVYVVTLGRVHAGVGFARVVALFRDNSRAIPANHGAPSRLALTDPDSSEVVPPSSPRFSGDFVLDSQGDQEQIYVSKPGTPEQKLWALALGQAVDDTAWAETSHGELFATDNLLDTVNAIRGTFQVGTAFTSVTPCDANSAPSTCPGPGYPPNYLGTINLTTGQISPATLDGLPLEPNGLHFLSAP